MMYIIVIKSVILWRSYNRLILTLPKTDPNIEECRHVLTVHSNFPPVNWCKLWFWLWTLTSSFNSFFKQAKYDQGHQCRENIIRWYGRLDTTWTRNDEEYNNTYANELFVYQFNRFGHTWYLLIWISDITKMLHRIRT